jgi:CheY-like chemotaxis protein
MKKESAPPVRILLVDDNVLGSTARGMILTEQGYTVEAARSGDEAWELFQREQFDIVVTDYKMPGMNGIELIGLIRASQTPARIILLSGRIKDMGMTEKSTGADELVSKSNKEVPELIRAVKKLATRPRRRGVASQKAVAKAAPKTKNAQA